MVGGEAEAFERARPLFELLGSLVVHVGGHGAGQAAKLCNNLIAGTTMAALAEACAIAVAEGIERATLYQLLTASTGDSRVLRTRFPLAGVDDAHPSSNAYAPLFALDLIAKDLALALALAEEHRVEAAVAAAALAAYGEAQLDGLGALDYSAVYRRGESAGASRLGRNPTRRRRGAMADSEPFPRSFTPTTVSRSRRALGRGRRDRAAQLDHARDERCDPRPPRRASRLRSQRRVLHPDALVGRGRLSRLRDLDDPHAAGVGQRQPLGRRLATCTRRTPTAATRSTCTPIAARTSTRSTTSGSTGSSGTAGRPTATSEAGSGTRAASRSTRR